MFIALYVLNEIKTPIGISFTGHPQLAEVTLFLFCVRPTIVCVSFLE